MRNCEIRNAPGQSSYFGGGFRGYGRYQWNVKFYGWQSDFEIETACNWALGDFLHSKCQFEYLNEVLGRPVRAHMAGRSGGWLVIDTELTEAELLKIDAHVKACVDGLPDFLKEERELNK